MNPTNQPVSFYGDNSRGTDSALLAAMATKDYSYDYPGMIGTNGICDLRESVKDAECNVRADVAREGQESVAATKDMGNSLLHSIHDLGSKLGTVECNLTKEVMENKFALATAIQKAEYEAKLGAEKVIKEVNDKAQYNADRNADKLQALKDFNADKFCALEKQLLKCCCEDEVRGVEQTALLNTIVSAVVK